MKLLTTEKVSVTVQDKQILSCIDLELEKGKIYSIIGPNGCGKSTFLKAITKHMKLSDGQVRFIGDDLLKKSPKEIAKDFAILWQKNQEPEDLTVYNLIEYGRFPHRTFGRVHEDERVIEQVIQTVQLDSYRDKKIGQLSGGEAQRAWLGMALAQEPSVLLLDEPNTYLDIAYQLDLLELVQTLNKEKNTTIIMVLHDLNQASLYSDEIIVFKQGRKIAQGSPEEVLTEDLLQDVFSISCEKQIDKTTGKPFFHSFKRIKTGKKG